MQAKIKTPAEFLERTDRLARRLGVSRRRLGPKIGLSTATIYNARKGVLLTDKTWSKLEQAEIAAGLAPAEQVSEGEQAKYLVSGSFVGGAAPTAQNRSAAPMMIDPRFQPRAEPTPEQCLRYFSAYITKAAEAEGGIGYVWVKLQKQFPLDEFDAPHKTTP